MEDLQCKFITDPLHEGLETSLGGVAKAAADLNVWTIHTVHYPIAIETGTGKHAFGVVVPDLPGCFSAGDTLDEAMDNAREAIEVGRAVHWRDEWLRYSTR